MKRQKYILVAGVSALFLSGLSSCKKSFLEPLPFGRYSQEQIQNKKGVEALLVGTYGMIDGQGIAGASGWMVGATNWVYGDVASDDAYKGTDAGDQPQMTEIERRIQRRNDSFRVAGDVLDLFFPKIIRTVVGMLGGDDSEQSRPAPSDHSGMVESRKPKAPGER